MRGWASKRLDFTLADWLYALVATVWPGGTESQKTVESLWAPNGDGLAGLSVRSLFDLYLATSEWKPGDRIIFTAFTVGDMPRIARERGFEVAVVDIDPITALPDPKALEAMITPATRGLVFTHLFGARLDVEPTLEVTRRHGVALVEDAAEAYAGLGWRGHEEADITLFSFGAIKTATAFGGGLATVRDPQHLGRMRELMGTYARQPRTEHLRRCFAYGILGLLGFPGVFGLAMKLARRAGGIDPILHRMTRGFVGEDFFAKIRRRPSTPLLRFLRRRLSQGDRLWLRRVGPGDALLDALEGVVVPAGGARPHTYWLVPVRSSAPASLVARLEAAGFNATRGRAFEVVEHDAGVVGAEPIGSRQLATETVYLPFSPQMPTAVLQRLGREVVDHVSGESSA